MGIGVRTNHVEFTDPNQGHVATSSDSAAKNRTYYDYNQLQDTGKHQQHSQEPVPTQSHTGYSTRTINTFPAKNNPKFRDSDTNKPAPNDYRNYDSEYHINQHREPSQEALPTQIHSEHSKFPETSDVESYDSREVYTGLSKLIDQWQKKSVAAEKSHQLPDTNNLANPSPKKIKGIKKQSQAHSKQRKLPKVPDHRYNAYQSRDIEILQALPIRSLQDSQLLRSTSQEDTVAPVGVGLSAPVEIHTKKDLSMLLPSFGISQEALLTHGHTGDSNFAPPAQSRTVAFAPPKNDFDSHFHTCDYYDSDIDELTIGYQYQSQDTEKESLPTQRYTGYTTLTSAQDEAIQSSSVGSSAPIEIYSKLSKMRDPNPALNDRNSEYHTQQSRKPTQEALPTQSHTRYPTLTFPERQASLPSSFQPSTPVETHSNEPFNLPTRHYDTESKYVGYPSREEWYLNVHVGGDDAREYGPSTGNHVEYVGPTTRERVNSPTDHQIEYVPAPRSREIDESGTSNPAAKSDRSYNYYLQDANRHLEPPPQESLPRQSRTGYSDSSIPTFSARGADRQGKEDRSICLEGYIKEGRKGLGTPSLFKRLAQKISSYVQTPAIPLVADLRGHHASRVNSEAREQDRTKPHAYPTVQMSHDDYGGARGSASSPSSRSPAAYSLKSRMPETSDYVPKRRENHGHHVQSTIEPSVTTSEDSLHVEGVQATIPGQSVGFFTTANNITIFGGSYQQNVYPTTRPEKNSQETRTTPIMQQPALIEVSDDLLGIGSCGTLVYRGSFQGRAVAVKKLLRKFVTLAEREVSILQQSDNHPNVIRYYHQEARENFLFIAIELCPGSLADIIEKPDRDQLRDIIINFDPKKALEEITSGLDHLHHLNIVHRDIKPQNILISAPQRAKSRNGKGRYRMLISDFGLCKKLDDDQTSFLPTTHGGSTVAGTRGWQGPEILRFKLKKGFIGEDLVEIDDTVGDDTRKLTKRRHPYGGEFERELNILKDTKDLRGLEMFQDEGLKAKDLIFEMLNPDPNQRPETMICLDHSYFNS